MQWTIDLNVKAKMIKLLEENKITIHDIEGFWQRFLGTQKSLALKFKSYKLDFIEFKNYSPKDTIKKGKRPATDWEKMFTD